MSRLCIVSRESPTLVGYLMVLLEKEFPGGDGIELVIDRRQSDSRGAAPSAPDHVERRHSSDVIADALRTQGYAVVGPDGVELQRPQSQALGARRLPSLASFAHAHTFRPSVSFGRVARLAAVVALCIAAGAGAVGLLRMTPETREDLVSRMTAWLPELPELPTWPWVGDETSARPEIAARPGTMTDAATPPVADTRRAPMASAPAPTVPPPAPQPAPPAAAASRPEPAPALPPASAARRDASSTLPTASASRRDAGTTLPPTAGSRREAPAPVPTNANARRDASADARRSGGDSKKNGAAKREVAASAPAAPTRTAKAAGPPRVELDARPEGAEADRVIVYTVRLSDANGRPLNDAAVSLHGWLPNGSDLTTSLHSTSTPGTYRASVLVGQRTPTNLRVRVSHEGMRFEVPSGR